MVFRPETKGDPDKEREATDAPELPGEARSTPGDAALARREKDEIDRYVDWQHDPEREYLPGVLGR